MTNEEATNLLKFYFPGSLRLGNQLKSEDGQRILERLRDIESHPLTITHTNQLLHLNHEAGMTDGCFRYYFLDEPLTHPYPVNRVLNALPPINKLCIGSLAQLDWGLRRMYIDALLYWGNVRSAYRYLRTKMYDELVSIFAGHRFPSNAMKGRGDTLPLSAIPDGDRYLISEIAGTLLQAEQGQAPDLVALLTEAFHNLGDKKGLVAELVGRAKADHPDRTMALDIACEDLVGKEVGSEVEIHTLVDEVRVRFDTARKAASENTRLYLSIVNEMDVYVATSMRTKAQFLEVAGTCKDIFSRDTLRRFFLRYFDPTISIADCYEDKGLIECLMVKCAQLTLYLAGEGDSFGKDVEVAMTLSLGKPAIILCPDTPKGKERERIFRDVHPLGRLINFETGVAFGAIVTRDRSVAAQVIERLVDNRMEYDLVHDKLDGYLRLKERLTQSVIRVQTNNRLLRETFWNYYHGVQ
jgi:hypothetical protein